MPTRSHVTTPTDIRQAATALEGVAVRTNLERSERLSSEAGVDILLKREDQQKCRSFKVRGAYARMSMLSPAERERGVVCASAGNHAQGLAYACAHLGVRGTIYLPSNTPRQKRRRIATIGGQWVEQVIVDGTFDRANALAQEAARATGRTYVHPYDDPFTIAGQGTIGVELESQMPADTCAVLVPVGGGGLVAGVSTWLRAHRPEVRIIGVEPAGAASMHAALEAGEPISLAKVDPFVDGTAVGRAGALPFRIAAQFVDSVLVVPEGAVCTEMLELYQSDGVIAEPAGALASTAAHVFLTDPADRKALLGRADGAIVCVVSGGNNDLTRYAEVMERSLRHEGLRHYFLVTFPQQPGMLRIFLEDVLGPADDIVHFEYTKKNNRELGPALVGIDLSTPDDIDGLRRRMESSPLHVEELPLDSEITRLVISARCLGGQCDGPGEAHAHGRGGVEAVTFSADRGDQIGGGGELLAQATDVSVDGARVGSQVGLRPHGGKEFGARHRTVCVGGQVGEEIVFLGGQSGIPSVKSDLSTVEVDVDARGGQSQPGQNVKEVFVGGRSVRRGGGSGRSVDEGHGCIRFFGAALPRSLWAYHCGGD